MKLDTEAEQRQTADFAARSLRAKVAGWIIIALALSFSILDLAEYRHHVNVTNPGFSAAEWERMTVARHRRFLPRYVEWEMLIVALALGAWLVVRQKNVRVSRMDGETE